MKAIPVVALCLLLEVSIAFLASPVADAAQQTVDAPTIAVSEKKMERVKIKNATLAISSGEPLRGATFFVDAWDVADMRVNEAKYREYFESIFRDRNLNCVRICPWIGRWSYDIVGNEHHQKEYLYLIDTVTRWCGELNIYAIVNLHIEYNTPVELDKAIAAWEILAPRYKDQSHVIYELVNEPEPESSLAVMSKLYTSVRTAAPDTHLILFSHVAATQYSDEKLKEASVGIDYSNASVGFHCYDSVLLNTKQWDRTEELRKAGYPMICTEFISLTDNNHVPIHYDNLMHCMMRAEERKLAWISWGPFAQYHNVNKKGWTHDAVRYGVDFENQLNRFGIDLKTGPQWLADGKYRIQCVWGNGFMLNASDTPWNKTQIGSEPEGDLSNSAIWNLQRIDGNIYRLKSERGKDMFLQGDFKDDATWKDLQTMELNADWSSQKFQLLYVKDNVYHIKCLWGNLYLSGRDVTDKNEKENSIRTAPLNTEWTSQHWRLVPVGESE